MKHLYAFTFFLTLSSMAEGMGVPECLANDGHPLPVNNEEALRWKESTANQFVARAHVFGKFVRFFANQTGHQHFEIQIGPAVNATLEVISSMHFGVIPPIAPAQCLEVCGDYITSNASTEQYPASPVGAIIHWVHRSKNVTKHVSGFVAIDDIVYGLD